MLKTAFRLFCYIILVTVTAEAQNLTKSPYSILGIGEIHYAGTSQQSAMGQVGQGLRRSAYVNDYNPASYSGLKYTVIDGGMLFSSGQLEKGDRSTEIDNFSFAYFSIAMPLSLKRNIGLGLGLSPYSSSGYNVSTLVTYPDYVGVTEMRGSGGISKFHVGVGAQLFNKLSAGVTANYLFGQIIREQKLIVPTRYNKTNLAETRVRNANDFQFEVGLQFHDTFSRGRRKDQYQFVAGLTYVFGTNTSASETYYMRSLGVGGTLVAVDTILYDNSKKGEIKLPMTIRFGVGLEKKDNWQIAADVNYTQWSAYRSFGVTDSLHDNIGVSVGGSYIPNSSDFKNYFNRVEYRAGARYDNGYLTLNGKNISTYALSAGMGMPLGKTRSKLNLTFEYMVRGTTSNNLIREEYFRFIVGLNFTDKWFQRYKYD
jgi:hypothetical protein